MQEITNDELEAIMKSESSFFFLFVHTPLCGTCKLAKRMIEVIEQSLPHNQIYMMNINEEPKFAQRWKVESVPSLLVFKNHINVERIYAFHSIERMYRLFMKYSPE